jgi:hypothetical protein
MEGVGIFGSIFFWSRGRFILKKEILQKYTKRVYLVSTILSPKVFHFHKKVYHLDNLFKLLIILIGKDVYKSIDTFALCMQSLYLATIFAGAIACLLTSLLLFLRRKSGERSRLILSCIVLFSVYSYIARFVKLSLGEEPSMLISAPMLLGAIFMSLSYILYPIEVISPGYLSFKRILGVYSPGLILVAVNGLCLLAGISFPTYPSLLDMLHLPLPVQAWFLLLLCVVFLLPVLCLFFIPYTRRYNNTDKQWMLKYALCFSINTVAYLIVLTIDATLV